MLHTIRDIANASTRGKLGGLLLSGGFVRSSRRSIPRARVAYLLGLRHLGVVAHGSFTARNRQSDSARAGGVEEDVVGRTHSALEAAGALRRAGVPTAS